VRYHFPKSAKKSADIFSATPLQTITIGGLVGEISDNPSAGICLRLIWREESDIIAEKPEMQPIIRAGEIIIWVAETEEKLWFWRPGLSLYIDLVAREGEAKLSLGQNWQNVLRATYFYLLLERQGLLLHASGLTRTPYAYIFPGPSGAGKTTVVRNSQGMPILNDEIVAIRMRGVEAIAHGTPFCSERSRPGENIAAPVKGLYFPCHSQENYLTRLSPKEILNRLLPCVCTYTTFRPRLKKIFDLAAELAESVPGYALHFSPDPSFWQVINAS
jgi:hypothetical protein